MEARRRGVGRAWMGSGRSYAASDLTKGLYHWRLTAPAGSQGAQDIQGRMIVRKYELRDEVVILSAIVVAGVVTYLPAFNNFFIQDDFYYLSQIRLVRENPSHLLAIFPGFYRITTALFFLLGDLVFGLNPVGYYALGLAVHLIVSYFVYLLVRRTIPHGAAAFVAALFFAVYERHREAVFWISAVGDLLYTLGVLLCLCFWRHLSPGDAFWKRRYLYSIVAFSLAALSKESSIVIVPLMVATDFVQWGKSPRQFISRLPLYLPFVVVSALYAVLVFRSNPIIAHGFYAVTWNFFTVYAKTLNTLLKFVFIGLLLILFFFGKTSVGRALREERAMRFYAVWLLVAPIPYCFLTYLDQIPSRHTYLASVGTAGLVGILAARLNAELVLRYSKRVGYFLLLLLVGGNMAYVWIKDKQFVIRAAPTRLVIDTLQRDERSGEIGERKVYVVCDSQDFQIPIRGAVELFTQHEKHPLIFLKSSEKDRVHPASQDHVFQCDEKAEYLSLVR